LEYDRPERALQLREQSASFRTRHAQTLSRAEIEHLKRIPEPNLHLPAVRETKVRTVKEEVLAG
jgi:hypothetical protein